MNRFCKLITTILLFSFITAVPSPIDPKSFTLTTDMDTLASAVSSLSTALSSHHLSVSQIMDNANRNRESLCNNDAFSPLETKSGSGVVGFCWQDGDDSVDYWYPQGITTTHDASSSGDYDGHQLVLASWYHVPDKEGPGTPDKGVRLSFVDWDADWPNTYRHVLLVEPTTGDSYKAVQIHAGGITWFGNLLYVVDTYNGFRLFDFDHIYQVDASNANVIGKSGDNYYAYGYAAIMLQTGSITNTGADLRFSFVSLDRKSDPPSLIVGEYSTGEGNSTSSQLVRFPLNTTTYLPQAEDDGSTVASEAYDTGIKQMQGALAREGQFWFGSSNGGGGPSGHYGFLRFWERGTDTVQTYDWVYGGEDLSYYEEEGDVTDRIFTLSEYPNWRVVVSVPQAEWQETKIIDIES